MIIDILHHGITVRDIDEAIDWYTRALGLELVHRQRQENAYTPILVGIDGAILEVAQLALPGGSGTSSSHNIELIQYVTAGTQGSPALVNQVGAAHLAFLVADIDALYERALAAGAQFRNPPVDITAGANTGGRACYLHDPDGNTLEFLERAASVAERTASG